MSYGIDKFLKTPFIAFKGCQTSDTRTWDYDRVYFSGSGGIAQGSAFWVNGEGYVFGNDARFYVDQTEQQSFKIDKAYGSPTINYTHVHNGVRQWATHGSQISLTYFKGTYLSYDSPQFAQLNFGIEYSYDIDGNDRANRRRGIGFFS